MILNNANLFNFYLNTLRHEIIADLSLTSHHKSIWLLLRVRLIKENKTTTRLYRFLTYIICNQKCIAFFASNNVLIIIIDCITVFVKSITILYTIMAHECTVHEHTERIFSLIIGFFICIRYFSSFIRSSESIPTNVVRLRSLFSKCRTCVLVMILTIEKFTNARSFLC